MGLIFLEKFAMLKLNEHEVNAVKSARNLSAFFV